jgi:hypothetical protein
MFVARERSLSINLLPPLLTVKRFPIRRMSHLLPLGLPIKYLAEAACMHAAFSCSGLSLDAHFHHCSGSGKHAKVCLFFEISAWT